MSITAPAERNIERILRSVSTTRLSLILAVFFVSGITAINVAFDGASRRWAPTSPWWVVIIVTLAALAIACAAAVFAVPEAARRWRGTNPLSSLWLGVAGSIGGSVALAGARLFRAAITRTVGDSSFWVWVAGNAVGFAVFIVALAALAPRRRGAADQPGE